MHALKALPSSMRACTSLLRPGYQPSWTQLVLNSCSKSCFFRSLQGTAPDIFEQIEANPDYQPQLDTRIMPGTKNVPRCVWQTRGHQHACLSNNRLALLYSRP